MTVIKVKSNNWIIKGKGINVFRTELLTQNWGEAYEEGHVDKKYKTFLLLFISFYSTMLRNGAVRSSCMQSSHGSQRAYKMSVQKMKNLFGEVIKFRNIRIESCLNFWDEAWWFLSLRVFGLLSGNKNKDEDNSPKTYCKIQLGSQYETR